MLRRRVLYRRSARMASRLMRQRGKGYGQHQRHQANGGKYFPFSHFFFTPFPAFPCFCLLYHADVTLRSNLHQKKKKTVTIPFLFLKFEPSTSNAVRRTGAYGGERVGGMKRQGGRRGRAARSALRTAQSMATAKRKGRGRAARFHPQNRRASPVPPAMAKSRIGKSGHAAQLKGRIRRRQRMSAEESPESKGAQGTAAPCAAIAGCAARSMRTTASAIAFRTAPRILPGRGAGFRRPKNGFSLSRIQNRRSGLQENDAPSARASCVSDYQESRGQASGMQWGCE